MNSQLLNKKISEKGLKKQYIAGRLGVSDVSLSSKIAGKRQFKADEMQALVRLLDLTDADIRAIFFA